MHRQRAYAAFCQMYTGCLPDYLRGADVRNGSKCVSALERMGLQQHALPLFRTDLPAFFLSVVYAVCAADVFVRLYPAKSKSEEREQLLVRENREYVISDKNVNNSNDFGCQMVAKRLPQESIDKDRVDKVSQGKERAGKEKEDKESEEKESVDKEPEKRPHGLYKNVFLTDTEFDTLQKEYPDYRDMIENLSRKIEMKGYQYQNHFVTLIEWAKEDAKKVEVPPAPPASSYDYEAIRRASLERRINSQTPPPPDDFIDDFEPYF